MEIYKEEAEVPITRDLLEQFLCPICYDTIEDAHRVFPCLREYIYFTRFNRTNMSSGFT